MFFKERKLGGESLEKCHCSFLDFVNDLFRDGWLGTDYTGEFQDPDGSTYFSDLQYIWLVLLTHRIFNTCFLCIFDFFQIFKLEIREARRQARIFSCLMVCDAV